MITVRLEEKQFINLYLAPAQAGIWELGRKKKVLSDLCTQLKPFSHFLNAAGPPMVFENSIY